MVRTRVSQVRGASVTPVTCLMVSKAGGHFQKTYTDHFLQDTIDEVGRSYELSCADSSQTMKIGGQFQFDIQRLQYSCEARQDTGVFSHTDLCHVWHNWMMPHFLFQRDMKLLKALLLLLFLTLLIFFISGEWAVSDPAVCTGDSDKCELPKPVTCAPVICRPVQPTIHKSTVKFVGQNMETFTELDAVGI